MDEFWFPILGTLALVGILTVLGIVLIYAATSAKKEQKADPENQIPEEELSEEEKIERHVTVVDMQTSARDIGNPWSLAKGMDTFGPISEYVPIEGIDITSLNLTLDVNGKRKQDGNTKDMIFTPEFLISYISRFMTLEPGDIIATGTPEGISEIVSGDVVCASISGVGSVTNMVV